MKFVKIVKLPKFVKFARFMKSAKWMIGPVKINVPVQIGKMFLDFGPEL